MNRIFWCPDCKRAYRDGEQRGEKPVRTCAYPDCYSLADMTHIRWQDLRRLRAELPENPRRDERYFVTAAECELAWRS